MKEKNISLVIIGLIWFSVGIFLSLRGIEWLLEIDVISNLIIFFVTAFVVGLVKGRFVLKRVAKKYCIRAGEIEYSKVDTMTGWVKVLGVKGILLIVLMIMLGILLRHSNIDRPILGVIYFAVGIAMLYASKEFFIWKNS